MTILRIATRTVGLGRPVLAVRSAVPQRITSRSSSTGPATVVDRGFWKSLIPKPLRREARKGSKGKKSQEWNPATYFIVMFLFIGSMSIQMIALRNQTERYERQSTVRLAQLRDALERIRNGEHVDIDRLMGTGEQPKEADWEEMLQAIERDEAAQIAQEAEKTKSPEITATTQVAETISATPTDPTQVEPESEQAPTKTKSAGIGNFF